MLRSIKEVGVGILEAVIAGLIVAGISGGVGSALGKRSAKRKYRQACDAAVKEYAKELDALITHAKPDGRKYVEDARSIVLVRNNLRSTLVSLERLLNSEIDRLEEMTMDRKDRDGNEDAIRESMAVLKKAWPARSVQIQVEVRKILTELGLESG